MLKKEFERKQREAQEATAYVFEEFIRTFQDNPGPPNKTFVKSGIFQSGQEVESDHGQIYNPQPLLKQNSSMTIKNAIECARLLKEDNVRKSKDKPKTNLEMLKEELKQRHLERGERNKSKDDLSLYSTVGTSNVSCTDPTTTNIFIANLNPKVTEQDLMKLFGSYGPLASVKIMWPRLDDKNRASNCGFVAFMSRKDGERAMIDLKERDDMRLGWGKPIDLPASPVYIPPELLKLSLPPPSTGLPFNAQPLDKHFKQPTTDDEMQELLKKSVVKVAIPLDKRILMIVHRIIEFVVREGPLLEAMIMNREINNPSYQFLFDNKNPVHIYYRWKLFSIMQGEGQKTWSTKEFRMFKGGSIWKPPIVPNYTQGMPDQLILFKTEKNMLSEAQRIRFIHLIQTLNGSRKKVGEAMVFCLNHSEAASDVVEIVIESLSNKSTKPPKKVARLYLLSDVLYNSSMKKCYAPVYRTEFEKHLVNIFTQLNSMYKDFKDAQDKDIYKNKVLKVLHAWDLWKIYPDDFLNQLENIFLGINNDDNSDDNEPLDGASLRKLSIKNGVSDCVVQRPIKPSPDKTFLSGFIPSKWEIVDPDQVELQAMSTQRFCDLELERQIEEQKKKSKEISDHERDLLRKVEVLVMQYQDQLENGRRKVKKGKTLEKDVEDYRSRTLEKLRKGGKKKVNHELSSVSSGRLSFDETETKRSYTSSKKRKRRSSNRERSRKRSYKS